MYCHERPMESGYHFSNNVPCAKKISFNFVEEGMVPKRTKSQCAWHSTMRGTCFKRNCCYFVCFIMVFDVLIRKYCYFVGFIRFLKAWYPQEKALRR